MAKKSYLVVCEVHLRVEIEEGLDIQDVMEETDIDFVFSPEHSYRVNHETLETSFDVEAE